VTQGSRIEILTSQGAQNVFPVFSAMADSQQDQCHFHRGKVPGPVGYFDARRLSIELDGFAVAVAPHKITLMA
jgi:hypothetical protein